MNIENNANFAPKFTIRSFQITANLFFGSFTMLLWVVDFFRFFGSMFVIASVIFIISGNGVECWIIFISYSARVLIPFNKLILYSVLIFIGVVIYGVLAGKEDGFTSFSVAAVCVQALYLAFGYFMIWRNNKAIREGSLSPINNTNQNCPANENEIVNNYAPEMPPSDDEIFSAISEDESEMKKKYEENKEFIEDGYDKILLYPEKIKFQNEIIGVVAETANPYDIRESELNPSVSYVV